MADFQRMNRPERFLFGVLLALLMLAPYAYAETIPATQSGTESPTVEYYDWINVWASHTHETAAAACTHATVDQGKNPGDPCRIVSSSPEGDPPNRCASYTEGSCFGGNGPFHDGLSKSTRYTCPSSGEIVTAGSQCATYTCPSGFGFLIDANGPSCYRSDCPSGQVRNQETGACEMSCPSGMHPDGNGFCIYDQCKAGEVVGSQVYSAASSTATMPNTTTCASGCQAKWSGSVTPVAYQGVGSGSPSGYVYYGQYRLTGATCTMGASNPTEETNETPEAEPPQTALDCLQKGLSFKEMNGIIVCVSPDTPGAPETTTQNPPTTEQNPDGSQDQTQSQTTVDPDTGMVTETTTHTTTSPTGEVTTSTSSTTSSLSDYCRENPTANLCKNSASSGGGDCATPPQSTGDAIQAAIVFQTWKTRCEAAKTNQALGEGSQLAANLAGVGEGAMNGEPTDLAELTEEIDVSGQISTAKFLSGSCIPDKVITGLPMGKTITIPFSTYCPYIEYFGMAMIALAMLGAARITGVF